MKIIKLFLQYLYHTFTIKQLFLIFVGGLIIIVVIFKAFMPDYQKPVQDVAEKITTPVTSKKDIGSEARLYVQGEDKIIVAVDEKAFDDFIKAKIAKDGYGLGQMTASLRVFMVPGNTRVLIIDTAMFRRKVRILEGEQAGLAGWVPYEWVL